MKFIADSMLGRLARWLRLLGCDTLYWPDIEDRRLVRIAGEEDRTLLTRDTRLVRMRGLRRYLLLHENDTFEQLRKVIKTFDLLDLLGTHPIFSNGNMGCVPLYPIYSRCSLCNTPLEEVPKEQAKEHVPEYVYLTSDRFRQCPACRKFYWRGTHTERLRQKLKEIL
ncbi:MAG: hypothetical protein C4560_00535 [Nitrospiraceae bacterium]|nr:MAG: hypothetical protein C4560_00535 [Nitrospiraceae bacterium]